MHLVFGHTFYHVTRLLKLVAHVVVEFAFCSFSPHTSERGGFCFWNFLPKFGFFLAPELSKTC